MRTRSSRFFVILLHLVGVCQDHQNFLLLFSSSSSSSYSRPSSGIVAVHPWPVQLESISLSSYHHGDECEQQENDVTTSCHAQDATIIGEPEPIWLQDSNDLSCLGPTGEFTECGDATLWFVQRQELPPPRMAGKEKRLLLSGLFLGRERDVVQSPEKGPPKPIAGWSFQVVDEDFGEFNTEDEEEKRGASRRKRIRQPRAECLGRSETGVEVLQCRRRRRKRILSSAVWLINEEGVLQTYDREDHRAKKHGEGREAKALCLHRGKGAEAALASCGDSEARGSNNTVPVRFSFVRYRAVTVPVTAEFSPQTGEKSPDSEEQLASPVETEPQDSSPSRTDSIPSSRDLAHHQALEPAMHPELKLSSQLLFSKGKRKDKDKKKGSPFAVLKDTNPILLVGGKHKEEPSVASLLHPSASTAMKKDPFAVLKDTNPILLVGGKHKEEPSVASLLHPSASTAMKKDDSSMKIRRIHVHPYIEKAKNEIWTDPQTGLQFFTDLCKYLGRDRKEHGRHTLMGVGQYRKGYVIKVYGVAYYVSKRDVLADPTFTTYSSMSAEQLRERADFYEHLRTMNLNDDSTSGKYDRTILLKTNMQISADTMRSSLQAEWKLLTDEAKRTLLGSSLQARPADEEMLKMIASPDNPSRCSCSQIAPEEYKADPGCCARGTELAFTWTKNGNLEVRLNRQVMEVFPRPDIAEAIFYEYLRIDDPMSKDLIQRVVDGFPFLLAPLAQVKGVNLGRAVPSKEQAPVNPIVKAFSGLAEAVSSQAGEMVGMLQRSAAVAAENAGNAARSLGDAAHNLAREVQHRRELIMEHPSSLPDAVMNIFSRDRRTMQTVSEWVERNITPSIEILEPARKVPLGRVFGYPLSRWFGDTYYQAPDEIGPMKIHPTMNTTRKIFLALVHLYLLLLFIVSFPGSYSTRTKLVIRRSLSRDFSILGGSSSAEASGTDISRSSKERLQCQESLLSRARQVLRPTFSDDNVPEEILCGSAETSPTLKKKSLGYFL